MRDVPRGDKGTRMMKFDSGEAVRPSSWSGRVMIAFAMLMTGGLVTPAVAQDATEDENGQGETASDFAGGIHLAAVFAELSYSKFDEHSDIPNPDKSKTGGFKFGGVVATGSNDTFVVPYLTFAKTDGEGSNEFASIETDSSLAGAGIGVTHFVTPYFRVMGGGEFATGDQDVVFNGADTSKTDIDIYSAYGGVDFDLFAYDDFLFGASDQIGLSHMSANFQPGNSVGQGYSRAWSNGFSLNGTWFATEDTTLGAHLTYVRLFGLETLPGEEPLDRDYGQISISAQHSLTDSVSVYGNIDHVVFNDLYDSTKTVVGLMTFF
ncbi:hypothetical protein [Thalassospira sp. ER-Se-21-Dark]|uniref:hypothetical protein n=1 Tax=Thalassospira sp. ER-Se-21-Dark TaxID=2585190 RepID=UPI001B305D4F|nr:hypothetical protein [Thalassospira sp. ER-Se-21-Dark]MBP3125733.1 hypothetical protein [Thalassospira sp. ER-Se-21-Dark]